MAQINRRHEGGRFGNGFARVSIRVRNGIRWWAEHQAWPARDAIRIEDMKKR